MTSKIHSDWFSKEDNKEELRKHLLLAKTQLSKLRDVVRRKLDTVLSQEDGTVEQYNNSDWAYKQAHINGQKNILKWLDQVLGSIE